MRVDDILTLKGSEIHSVAPDALLGQAVAAMHGARIGSAIVLDPATGYAIGIVSQAEILAALVNMGSAAMSAPTSQVMRIPAPQCAANTLIQVAMMQMSKDRSRHLVVLGADGQIVGVVSLGDLVAARVGSMELETAVLRDMARLHLMAGAA